MLGSDDLCNLLEKGKQSDIALKLFVVIISFGVNRMTRCKTGVKEKDQINPPFEVCLQQMIRNHSVDVVS